MSILGPPWAPGRPSCAARGDSSALDLDTEAGRAFLEERLAFYNKVCFRLSGGFFIVGLLLALSGVRPPAEVTAEHERRATLLHAATLVVQLSAWLACSSARRFAIATLRGIDSGALFLGCLGFALQSVSVSVPHVEQMGRFPRLTLMLILTNVLIARAVLVPSPTAWTAAVSTAAAVPIVASVGLSPAPPGGPAAPA